MNFPSPNVTLTIESHNTKNSQMLAASKEAYYERAKLALCKAIEFDETGKKREAISQYKSACTNALHGVRMEQQPADNSHRILMINRIKQWLTRAEVLNTQLTLESVPQLQHAKRMEDEIVGMENVKQILREAILLPITQPQVFKGKRKPWKSLLLFGPPGTGKTNVALAISRESTMCEFITITPSDVMSKYMGESEKYIKQVFARARASPKKRCVVFIDEIDSLGATRKDDGDNESSRRVLTELLKQMDGAFEDNGKVLVIAATNLPHTLDPALRRRFEKRIYVPLPTVVARAHMIAKRLGAPTQQQQMHTLTWQDVKELARQTEGFSGADLSALCNDILLRPVRTCLDAKAFRYTWDGYLVPSPIGMRMNMLDKTFDTNKLRVPAATMRDALYVLNKSKSSVGVGRETKHLEDFAKQFGELSLQALDTSSSAEDEDIQRAVLKEWKMEEETTVQVGDNGWMSMASTAISSAATSLASVLMSSPNNNNNNRVRTAVPE